MREKERERKIDLFFRRFILKKRYKEIESH